MEKYTNLGRRPRLTRNDIREIGMGETVTVTLPDAAKIRSGKTAAYQIMYDLGCRFEIEADYANNQLTLTKIPLR